jgi:hypothetical protein
MRAAYAEHAQQRTRPLLVTFSSEGAEALAYKNGLTVADLVRPFAAAPGAAFTLRTPAGASPLQGASFRVLPASELCAPSLDALEGALGRAVASLSAAPLPGAGGAPTGASDLALCSAEDAARWVARVKGGDATPWYTAFRRELASALRCLPQEAHDAPVAALLVASTLDENPVAAVRALAAAVARLAPQEQFDVGVLPRIVLLLHDGGGAVFSHAAPGGEYASPLAGRPLAHPGDALEKAHAAFGSSHVYLAIINSVVAPPLSPPPGGGEPWGGTLLEPLFPPAVALPAPAGGGGRPRRAARRRGGALARLLHVQGRH